MNLARISRAMDYLTGKRWFYALLYVLGFLVLLPYASKGYSWQEMWYCLLYTSPSPRDRG